MTSLEEAELASDLRAVLTDSHFWVPALVLAAGILLLVLLH